MITAEVTVEFAQFTREAQIVLAADETITAWNPAAARLLRISAATAIGQRWTALLPEASWVITPEPTPGETPTDPTWRRHTVPLPDGSEVEVDAAVAWHAGQRLLLLAEAAPAVAAAQTAEAVERHYRHMLDALPIGLTVISLRDELRPTLYQNNWGIEVSGWANAEWERDPDFTLQILHPDDRERMVAFRDQFAAEFAPFDVEYRVVRPDGGTVWLRDWGRIVHDEQGIADHAVVCLLDVTAQKTAEQALRDAVRELSTAHAEVAALSQAKSEYLSVLSHEFRTPLTSIQGFSELMAESDLAPAESRQFAGIIQTNARRLTRMISDLLDMDRLESGRRPVHWQPVALEPLLREVLATLAGLGHRHAVGLTLAADLPPIEADSDLLTQLVTNVVNNAIKYTPPGGCIDIQVTQPDPALVELVVADSGPGIPADALETIFQRFTRLPRDERQPIVGSGLGLPIARQIVELHRGRIWAENGASGARVVIQLPIAAASAAAT